MPIYDYKCRSCGTKETKVMRISEKEQTQHLCKCGEEQEQYFTQAPKGVNNLMKKGPLESYKDGDNKCFYTNQLMLNAQNTYL